MAWDHQNQEDCAILSGWLNKTSLLYIFSDFFLSTGNRANTHRQIYQVDCVYLNIYFFLLSIISVQLQFYLYFLSFFSFFFHLRFIKQSTPWNALHKSYPELVVSSTKQTSEGTVKVWSAFLLWLWSAVMSQNLPLIGTLLHFLLGRPVRTECRSGWNELELAQS